MKYVKCIYNKKVDGSISTQVSVDKIYKVIKHIDVRILIVDNFNNHTGFFMSIQDTTWFIDVISIVRKNIIKDLLNESI